MLLQFEAENSTSPTYIQRLLNLFQVVGKIGAPLLGVAALIAVWQVIVSFGAVSPVLLPSPAQVVRQIIAFRGLLWEHSLVTLSEILTGFFISALIGMPIGISIAFSRLLERVLYPLLIVVHSIPKIAIAPLFIIWLGFGRVTNGVIAVMIAIFPIVINTTLGLTHINHDFVRLGRIMGGSRLRIFWKIRVPIALPSIFAGLKVAMTLATTGAIVGELLAGQEGLGYLLQFAAGQLQTDVAFACIFCLIVLGLTLFYTVVVLEILVRR